MSALLFLLPQYKDFLRTVGKHPLEFFLILNGQVSSYLFCVLGKVVASLYSCTTLHILLLPNCDQGMFIKCIHAWGPELFCNYFFKSICLLLWTLWTLSGREGPCFLIFVSPNNMCSQKLLELHLILCLLFGWKMGCFLLALILDALGVRLLWGHIKCGSQWICVAWKGWLWGWVVAAIIHLWTNMAVCFWPGCSAPKHFCRDQFLATIK